MNTNNPKLALTLLIAIVAIGCGKATPVESTSKHDEAPARQSGDIVIISPQAAQSAGIEVATVGPATIRRTLTLYGHIQSEPERLRAVTARYPGVIRSVALRIGDRVVVGQTLATVESNESLRVYSVSSPIAGVITQRHANPGEATGTEALFEVADFSSVRAELSVFPKDRSMLKAGQKILVTASDGVTTGEGALKYIAPSSDSQNQSILARALLPNTDGRWTPGQFVTGDVEISQATVAISVSPSALQQIRGHAVVFVQTPKGFEARFVEIGNRDRDAVEIKQGLDAGERYVVKNSYLVKAEVLKSEAAED